jgi:DNA-binding LacI/PurR family transcriptional regulator
MAQKQPHRLTIDKLVGYGRRHFAYVYGRNSSWIDKQRRDWFSSALARHGLAFEAESHGDYSYDSGFKEASLLLRRLKVVVQLIERHETGSGAAPTIVIKCRARWGSTT